MIYGAIGYTILYNSEIFPNKEILLLNDSHEEIIKNCNGNIGKSNGNIINSNNTIQIDTYLEMLLNKNYMIFIEEVPSNKSTLIGRWDNSTHVKNIRKLYENNKDNKNLLPFDIRFEFVDSFDEKDYNNLTLKEYVIKIYKFFILEHDFFKDLILYSKQIDDSVIRKLYVKLMIEFCDFLEFNDLSLSIEIKKIKNKNKLIDWIHEFLSELMDFYVLLMLYNKIQTYDKIIVYGGFSHIDNIKKLLLKYYKFNIKEQDGIVDYNLQIFFDNNNQCINIPHFK
jgi:hypothetical protein